MSREYERGPWRFSPLCVVFLQEDAALLEAALSVLVDRGVGDMTAEAQDLLNRLRGMRER